MQYTQNFCIFSLENRNTSESRENHKTVDMKVTLLKLEQVGRRDGNVSAPFVLLWFELKVLIVFEYQNKIRNSVQ